MSVSSSTPSLPLEPLSAPLSGQQPVLNKQPTTKTEQVINLDWLKINFGIVKLKDQQRRLKSSFTELANRVDRFFPGQRIERDTLVRSKDITYKKFTRADFEKQKFGVALEQLKQTRKCLLATDPEFSTKLAAYSKDYEQVKAENDKAEIQALTSMNRIINLESQIASFRHIEIYTTDLDSKRKQLFEIAKKLKQEKERLALTPKIIEKITVSSPSSRSNSI